MLAIEEAQFDTTHFEGRAALVIGITSTGATTPAVR